MTKCSISKWQEVVFAIFFIAPSLTSCALQYFDPQTSTEHLWGFGHLKMKVFHEPAGEKAVVNAVEILGVGWGFGEDRDYFIVGWDQQTLLKILDADTCLTLEWPSANQDLFTVRIGGTPPPLGEMPSVCLP